MLKRIHWVSNEDFKKLHAKWIKLPPDKRLVSNELNNMGIFNIQTFWEPPIAMKKYKKEYERKVKRC